MFEGLFQPTHLILILVVAVIFFGPKNLPQVGAGLGKSIRDFKKAMADVNDDATPAVEAAKPPAELPAAASASVVVTVTPKAEPKN
jgi:sec-independent protein translocase protein TatA